MQALAEKGSPNYAYAREKAHPNVLGQGEEVAVAGRVMARRVMGKLAFVRLEDDSGSVQLYVDRAMLDASQPGGFRCESRLSQFHNMAINASAPL